MSKLKSRKFWMAVGAAVSLLIAEAFGVDVDPEAIGAIALIVGTYVIGQGMVDKSVVAKQVEVAGDVGRAQLELYARNLEDQLKEVARQAEIMEAAQELSQIGAVPEAPFALGPPLEEE